MPNPKRRPDPVPIWTDNRNTGALYRIYAAHNDESRRHGHWRKAWANSQQGFSILVSHLEKLLQQAGIQRLNTVGTIFDPVTMLAVATIEPNGQPLNVVVEEVAPGYRWRNEILRPAEVKITKSES